MVTTAIAVVLFLGRSVPAALWLVLAVPTLVFAFSYAFTVAASLGMDGAANLVRWLRREK